MGGFVADCLPASVASVNYDIATLCIGKCSYRAKDTATTVCSVTGVYVHVKRTEAERAVIARGVSEGQNLFAAVFAYKAVIIFRKTFCFHSYFPTQNFENMSATTSSETALPSSSAIAPSARSISDDAASAKIPDSNALIAEVTV